jgi:hypothetical protein
MSLCICSSPHALTLVHYFLSLPLVASLLPFCAA